MVGVQAACSQRVALRDDGGLVGYLCSTLLHDNGGRNRANGHLHTMSLYYGHGGYAMR